MLGLLVILGLLGMLSVLVVLCIRLDAKMERARSGGPSRGDRPPHVMLVTSDLAVPVQIVFTRTSIDAVWIDCTLTGQLAASGKRLASGHPLSLCCAQPEDPDVVEAVGEIIGQWADDAKEVELKFIVVDGEPRIRLQADVHSIPTTLQLDLEQAVA